MAKTKISEYDATAANNTDVDSVNIAEGCAPSGINNAIREVMSHLKEFQTGAAGDDLTVGGNFSVTGTVTIPDNAISGDKVEGGTINAITINTLSANPTLSAGTANGVTYLNGSKVLTSGSALTFDGTTLTSIANGFSSALTVKNSTASQGVTAKVQNDAASGLTFTAYGSSYAAGSILSVGAGGSAIDVSTDLGLNAANTLRFGLGYSEKMRLTSTGLGIGTSSPANTLSVSGNANITGNTTLGDASTDTVTVNGYMGVGGAGASTASVLITNSALTGTSQYGVYSSPVFTSAATTNGWGFRSSPSTAAASFTMADLYHFRAVNASVGAGSTITNQHGVYISDQTSATNNYGITSLVSSGTNKWNIYASGTAANYFAGNIGIKTTTTTNGFLNFAAPSGGNTAIAIESSTGFDIIRRISATGSGLNIGALFSSGAPYIGYQVRTNPAADGYLSSTSASIGRSSIEANNGSVKVFTGSTQTSTDGGAVTLVENVDFTPTAAVFNNPGNDIDFRVESDTNSHAFFLEGSTGNVGIGTSSPSASLTISKTTTALSGTLNNYGLYAYPTTSGQANIDVLTGSGGNTSVALRVYNNGTYTEAIKNISGNTTTFQTAGTERARITSDGELLVGATTYGTTSAGFCINGNPASSVKGAIISTLAGSTNSYTTMEVYSTGASAYRFYVGMAGTVYATSTTITAISDQRLKENIRDLDDGLDVVMALKPRKFDWKEGKGQNIKGARGFIAQEFEQVLPDMVEEWRDPAPEGEEPYKAVNANLVPTLVKAIQEQQAIIESLTARVSALEGN